MKNIEVSVHKNIEVSANKHHGSSFDEYLLESLKDGELLKLFLADNAEHLAKLYEVVQAARELTEWFPLGGRSFPCEERLLRSLEALDGDRGNL